jgi:hypothetical protein
LEFFTRRKISKFAEVRGTKKSSGPVRSRCP